MDVDAEQKDLEKGSLARQWFDQCYIVVRHHTLTYASSVVLRDPRERVKVCLGGWQLGMYSSCIARVLLPSKLAYISGFWNRSH